MNVTAAKRYRYLGSDSEFHDMPRVGEYVEVKLNGLRGQVYAEVVEINAKDGVITISLLAEQPDGSRIGHFKQRHVVNAERVTISLTARIFMAVRRRHERLQGG